MKKIKVAILGLGTVGSGVKNILMEKEAQLSQKLYEKTGEHKKIEIKKVLVRNIQRDYGLDKNMITNDYEDILNDPEIQIVAELMGGENPATEYMTKAMEKGKHVISANKMAIAKSKGALDEKAKEQGVSFMYEASVAGTIPVIRVINDCLVANKIQKISGIINGTTNYILSKMANEGQSFEAALREAQELGFAEADPSADVEGDDAMYKIAIMSKLAFGKDVELGTISKTGITGITEDDVERAKKNGRIIKFLAQAEQIGDVIEISVSLQELEKTHPLANVDGAMNAVYITCDNAGEIMLQGAGAGSRPTASAVVSDIFAIAERL
ncbi:MAG: homoserine dehydrogenase [Proteocatella sp.]